MAKRYFNWKLAFVLVVALLIFAVAVGVLHSWQKNLRAEQSLDVGQQAYEKGDWDAAAGYLGRYLGVYRNDPNAVPVLLKYAEAQLNRRPMTSGNVQQAIAAYSSVSRLDTSNAEAARQLVQIYLSYPTPAAGEAELRASQYLKVVEDDPEIRRLRGVALYFLREFEQARQMWLEVIADHPDEILSYELLGQLAKERPEDALTYNQLRDLAEKYSRHAEVYTKIVGLAGSSLEDVNRPVDWFGAARAFDRDSALASTPREDDPEGHVLSVGTAQLQRDFEQARQTLLDRIGDDPNKVPVLEEMGQLAKERPDDALTYKQIGDLAEKCQRQAGVFRKIVELAGSPQEDLKNKPPDPLVWFRAATAFNPDSALAYVVCGGYRLMNDDRDGAITDFNQALSLDLSDAKVRQRLISSLIAADAFDMAREQLDMLGEQTPTDEVLWRLKTAVAIQSGSEQEMREVAEAGLEALATYPWGFMSEATELFIRAGQLDEAESCIIRMQKREMGPDGIVFLQGLLAQQRGELRQAIEHWQQVISLREGAANEQGRELATRLRMELAATFLQLGDVPSAMKYLQSLLSAPPQAVSDRVTLMHLLAQVGNWPAVLDQAQQLRQLKPEQAERQLEPEQIEARLLGMQARLTMLETGDVRSEGDNQMWRQIDDELEKLEEEIKGDPRIAEFKARSALLQGKDDQADRILEAMAGDPSRQLRANLLRVGVYLSRGDDERAETLLQQTVAAFPQSVEAARNLGLLLNRQDKRDKCEAVLKQAVETIEEPVARRSLGLLLADLYRVWGQVDKLQPWLQNLRQQFPDAIEIKRALLAVKQVAEDTGQAQQLVDEIKALEGEDGWQWRLEQARVWMVSDDRRTHSDKAVQLLQENLLAYPDDQASRMVLAMVYDKSGQRDLAVATYQDALSRSPNNTRLIALTVAALYKAGRGEQAAQLLARAQERDLYNPDFRQLELEGYLRQSRQEGSEEARGMALDSAAAILRELLTQDPNNVPARRELVNALAKQQKYDEAQTQLDDLRTRVGAQGVLAAQVELYLSRGDDEAALRLCNERVGSQGDVSAYVLRGTVYTRLNQSANAIEDFRKALVLAPDNAGAQLGAMGLFLNSGDPDLVSQGLKFLDGSIARYPDNMDLKLMKAQYLFDRQTVAGSEQARQLLSEVTREQPQSASAWILLARLELRERQPNQAADAALRGLTHCPESTHGPLLWWKAQAEAQLSPALAIPTLKELLLKDPDNIDVIEQLVNACLGSDRPETALELLRERTKTLTGAAQRRIRMRLAEVLYRSGDTAAATTHFRDLMATEPDDPKPIQVWVELLASDGQWDMVDPLVTDWQGRHPDDIQVPLVMAGAALLSQDPKGLQMAADMLLAVRQRQPKSTAVLHVLANVVDEIGHEDQAVALNREILTLNPNDVVAMNNLAWILGHKQGQYQAALDLANRGLEVSPDYADLIDTRGVMRFHMKRYDEAERDFSRCLDLYPASQLSSLLSRFHLAQVYVATGGGPKAIPEVEEIAQRTVPLLSEALDRASFLAGPNSSQTKEMRSVVESLKGILDRVGRNPDLARGLEAPAMKVLEGTLAVLGRPGRLTPHTLDEVRRLVEQYQGL